IGRDKTAARYERLLAERQQLDPESVAYHQQHLVSFYHTVFLPYSEFRSKWFEHLEAIDLNGDTVRAESLLQDLERLARETFRETEPMAMPDTSPLLQESHDNYLKSLKLFEEALDRFRPGGRTGGALVASLEGDAYIREAKIFGLAAQTRFFEAIVAWKASVDAGAPAEPVREDDLVLTDWAKLDLTRKSAFAARFLEQNGYFEPYLPLDLTIRIDEMILAGSADSMNLSTVAPIADMLVTADAVRPGDFIRKRDKFYRGETLPQLPFYAY